MQVKVTSKRQVTFPKHVLDWMGVAPGDRLEVIKGADGYVLKPRRIDFSRLGGLRNRITPGTPPFNVRKFRDEEYDPAAYRD